MPRLTGKWSWRFWTSIKGRSGGGGAGSGIVIGQLSSGDGGEDLVGVVTGGPVSAADVLEGGAEFAADISGEATARGEGATGGEVSRVGRSTLNRDNALSGSVKAGDGVEEPQSIGMVGAAIDRRGRTDLDGAAGVHDKDTVCVAGHDAEIVGDEDHGRTRFFGELGQELQDLRLDGDVEGGSGLVGEEDLRVAAESHGDHDALAHAAGELVRVAVEAGDGVRDAHSAEERGRARARLIFRQTLVKLERLSDLRADLHDRVERGHGLLKDHGDIVAADAAELWVGNLKEDLGRWRAVAGRRERARCRL